MHTDNPRPTIAGTSEPEPPFPVRLSGPIVKGFGRGSKELGIPTANIPLAGLSIGGHEGLENGVYFGWAGVDIDSQGHRTGETAPKTGAVWGMVMSIGWNPFYKNTKRSVVLMKFPSNFHEKQVNGH